MHEVIDGVQSSKLYLGCRNICFCLFVCLFDQLVVIAFKIHLQTYRNVLLYSERKGLTIDVVTIFSNHNFLL